MDMKNMEEEYNALLSDKAGEAEYLHSLQGQIEKLKVYAFTRFCLLFYDRDNLGAT